MRIYCFYTAGSRNRLEGVAGGGYTNEIKENQRILIANLVKLSFLNPKLRKSRFALSDVWKIDGFPSEASTACEPSKF